MRKILALILAMLMLTSFAAVSAEETESGWQNILLMGSDSRNMDKYRLTDAIIILSINRDESLVKMTSVMRDIWVEYPSVNKSEKINAANVFGGPELSIETINRYFGTDIEDYVIINMDDLVEIVDLMGGVDIDVTESERAQINKYVKSDFVQNEIVNGYAGDISLNETGLVHLNGLLAMSYCRDRYSDSDYQRVMRQQEVLLALAENAQNMEVDALMDVAGQIYDVIETSMEKSELEDLATAMMVMEVEDVEQFRLPADGTFQSGMYGNTWMIKPDFAANKAALHDFIYG